MNNTDDTNIFQGVWPAMFTPVSESGELNVHALEQLVELLVAQQVDGLYILGSTGQGFLFSEEQRKKMVEFTMKIVGTRLPVMVQVGALNTDESVRLAKHAAKHHVQGISSVGPIYYPSSMAMGVEHYRNIALATDLPFFPYKIGNAIMNEEVIDRLLQIRNIRGLKLTTQNLVEISNIHNQVGDVWKLFSGADELLCQASLCGTVGAIGTTYNLIGATCKHVRQEFLRGNIALGMEFMFLLQKIINRMLPCIWTFFNTAMKVKHGIDIGHPRPPLLSPAMDASNEEVLEMVNELDAFSRKTLVQNA